MNKEIIKSNAKIKNDVIDNGDTHKFMREKIHYFQEIIRNTILSITQYKTFELFSNSDLNICVQSLYDLYEKTNEIITVLTNSAQLSEKQTEDLIELLQGVIDKLSVIICGYGTQRFSDLLFICFGSQYLQKKCENEYSREKIDLIMKYVHPVSYKTQVSKHANDEFANTILCSNKITEDIIQIEKSNNYECYDVDSSNTKFHMKIYGIRVILQNSKTQKTLIVNGLVDDMIPDLLTNKYIEKRKKAVLDGFSEMRDIDMDIAHRYVNTLTLKDYLIYGNEDIYKKYGCIFTEINWVKQNKLDTIIKKFVDLDIFEKRSMLLNMLIYNKDNDLQYITYLLYDLLTPSHGVESVDSGIQSLLYNSLPWSAKQHFKDVMKFTIKYTQDMFQKYDTNRVTLEQQIYVMQVPEYIKEKAMVKLKEIKGKHDESGTKAKQYLEGLLKIPFNIYKQEPILQSIKHMNASFTALVENNECNIPKKAKYTTLEILKWCDVVNKKTEENMRKFIQGSLQSQNNKDLGVAVQMIHAFIQSGTTPFALFTGKNKASKVKYIQDFVGKYGHHVVELYDAMRKNDSITQMYNNGVKLQKSVKSIENDLQNITNVLDASIHGHDYAKNQILKIIGQWMNGEQTGYCFGFEGSPGVGKTSVAKKGLAKCLVDADGKSRPFAFIALGGSCNGSTLEGHSYTYVNSIWGRIVDILMETKCMNPIIYVDELDKVSKTEHGKEIIGILTHLIDTTQNDCFQDKYYAGINLDLSKALFIFSYNDPENIDRILLDRIHRIRFDNLTLDNKMVIVKDYLLPEINEKMGFCDSVVLEDSVIEYIIETYTMEPGVRKLKEVIFDLFGEINLEILKCGDENMAIPVVIEIEDLETKYLKKYHKIQETKIPEKSGEGIINGLWANALGKGGIIPIETMLFPCASFLELRLTGLQGDVMKESMNVAKSLAWLLTPLERKKELLKEFEETKCQGLHIHCPQGAVSKDGPSAGTAITIAIYSLFNKRKIINTVAITGEINLQGQITAIGGLDSKILGGIRAGVKRFLYPKENHREYSDFMEKYGGKPFLENIEFIEVAKIEEVFQHVFE